jgi:hypothetical protein
VVFYCVIVDEDESEQHQRISEDRNNQRIVLSNIVFYRNQNASVKATQKSNSNIRGKTAKLKKRERRIKGKHKSYVGKISRRNNKRYILLKCRSRKLDLEFFLLKKEFKTFKLNLFTFILSFSSFFSTRNCKKLKYLIIYKSIYNQSRLFYNVTNKKFETSMYKLESSLKVIISAKCIWKEIVQTLLVRGNVETNPGPEAQHNPNSYKEKNILEILTFNCYGLSQRSKRRRILYKASAITNKGGIVMLQETHVTKEEQVSSMFKDKFQLNQYTSNSAGVLTLFSSDFDLLSSYKDDTGRVLITVLEKKGEKYLVVNV